MVLSVIATLIWAFATIYWKKCLSYWVKWKLIAWYYFFFWFILIIWIFIFVDLNLENLLFCLGLWWLYCFSNIYWDILEQRVYAEEELSYLSPFEQLWTLFKLIFWFIIFRDSSYITLLVSLLTIAIIVIHSIDFKTYKLPKNIKDFLIFTSIFTYWAIIIAYWAINYWPVEMFIAHNITCFTAYSIVLLWNWEYKYIRKVPKWFLKDRLISTILLSIAIIITLNIINDIWVVTTTLLSFLSVWVTLILSFIYFKDTPSKKDLLVTILVTALIWLWYYFK